MTTTPDRIRNAVPQHTSLLLALHQTESAPSQLHQQNQYIADLGSQVALTHRQVSRLTENTSRELKHHKRYAESTLFRFLSGLTVHFNAKAAKVEKDYVGAIQAQKSCEDELAYLQSLLEQAESKRAELSRNVRTREDARRELDGLYDSVFAGHAPEFPEEDACKLACEASSAALAQASQDIETERRVGELLRQACTALADGKNALEAARDISTVDMWDGGPLVSLAKREALQHAEECVGRVRALVEQVRLVEPGRELWIIWLLGDMDVDVGNIWTDVVFDNIFTDMDMHQRIKDTDEQMDRALQIGARLMNEQQAKEKELIAEASARNAELRERRGELEWIREETFRRVVGGEDVGKRAMPNGDREGDREDEPPPAYSETT